MKLKSLLLPAAAVLMSGVTAVGAVSDTPNAKEATGIQLPTITKSVDVNGTEMKVSIDPNLAIEGAQGIYKMTVAARINAEHLRPLLINAMQRNIKKSECGRNAYTHGASIGVNARGAMTFGVNVTGEVWNCLDVPYIRCTKGRKWYHLPKCSKAYKRVKNKTISQSARIEGAITGRLSDGSFVPEFAVTKAMPTGLLKEIVKTFGLHGKLKGLLEKEVNKALDTVSEQLPKELSAYKVTTDTLKFAALSNGSLAVDITASGSITVQQIAGLVLDQFKKMN